MPTNLGYKTNQGTGKESLVRSKALGQQAG